MTCSRSYRLGQGGGGDRRKKNAKEEEKCCKRSRSLMLMRVELHIQILLVATGACLRAADLPGAAPPWLWSVGGGRRILLTQSGGSYVCLWGVYAYVCTQFRFQIHSQKGGFECQKTKFARDVKSWFSVFLSSGFGMLALILPRLRLSYSNCLAMLRILTSKRCRSWSCPYCPALV